MLTDLESFGVLQTLVQVWQNLACNDRGWKYQDKKAQMKSHMHKELFEHGMARLLTTSSCLSHMLTTSLAYAVLKLVPG